MVEDRVTARQKLEEQYPVGNVPVFEGKRVWKNPKTGSYIELTEMRLKAWANALVSDTAHDLPESDESM